MANYWANFDDREPFFPLGLVILTDSSVLENPAETWPLGHPVAWANRQQYVGSDTHRGSANINECAADLDWALTQLAAVFGIAVADELATGLPTAALGATSQRTVGRDVLMVRICFPVCRLASTTDHHARTSRAVC